MIYELTNDEIRNPTQPFDFEKYDAKEEFENLKESLIHYRGLGLSANQVGKTYSAFVFGDPDNPSSVEVMFDPQIVSYSMERNSMDEGCLSYRHMVAKVERSNVIRVRFTDLDGRRKTATFNGLTARIIQHEMDHLNGVIFTDHISDMAKRRAIEKANKKHKTNFVFRDLQTA
jgi:peptide deformylase